MALLVEVAWIVASTIIGSATSDYLQPVNSIGSSQFNQSTLKFVSVHARHGSRSPLSTFPTDACPYDNLQYWPDGKGRLTKTGKKQAYALGKLLRSRYGGFINSQYYDNETIFQSNACDRDLTSSQMMAAGMYPPTGFQIWNVDLLWQPVGVWVTDYDVDDTSSNCARFIQEKDAVMEALGEEFNQDNWALFTEIANFTGINVTEVHNRILDVWSIPLLDSENECPEVEWANTTLMDAVFPLAAKSFRMSIAGNDVMTHLIAGPVLQTLIDQLNNKTQGTLDYDRKMSVLACHDSTIISLLGGLGIEELVIPDSSSSLIFELHESTDGSDIVQVLYFNHSTTSAPTLFEIPDCTHPCSLANLSQLALKTIANSSRTYCDIEQNSTTEAYSLASGLSASLGFIALISLLISPF